jgi:hypothetical protein
MKNGFGRMMWVSVGIIVGSFLVFGAALYWTIGDLDARLTEITSTRQTISSNTKAIQSLASLKEFAPQVQAYQDRINLLLPGKDDLLDFPHQIESLARLNHVATTFTFKSVPTPPTETEPGYIGFSLTVVGGYDGVQSFLRAFETQSSRFSVILDTFDVNSGVSDSDYHLVTDGRVFFK